MTAVMEVAVPRRSHAVMENLDLSWVTFESAPPCRWETFRVTCGREAAYVSRWRSSCAHIPAEVYLCVPHKALLARISARYGCQMNCARCHREAILLGIEALR